MAIPPVPVPESKNMSRISLMVLVVLAVVCFQITINVSHVSVDNATTTASHSARGGSYATSQFASFCSGMAYASCSQSDCRRLYETNIFGLEIPGTEYYKCVGKDGLSIANGNIRVREYLLACAILSLPSGTYDSTTCLPPSSVCCWQYNRCSTSCEEVEGKQKCKNLNTEVYDYDEESGMLDMEQSGDLEECNGDVIGE